MTDDLSIHPVIRQVIPWRSLILETSKKYEIDPHIVGGLISQESRGNPWAIRPEVGFFRRWSRGLKRILVFTKGLWEDGWVRYPEIAGASYGLCQVPYPLVVKRRLARTLEFPTELLDPKVNLDVGCQILETNLTKHGMDYHKALQQYSKNEDENYAGKVKRRANILKQENFFEMEEEGQDS